MCGFTGFVSSSAPDRDALRAMGDSIHHRGPDDEGYYTDDHCGIAHRRLSIIDLKNGRQPMISPDGRYTLAYNGEIYNFQELRRELTDAGHTFLTNCDSEVLLHGYMQWGGAGAELEEDLSITRKARVRRLSGVAVFLVSSGQSLPSPPARPSAPAARWALTARRPKTGPTAPRLKGSTTGPTTA